MLSNGVPPCERAVLLQMIAMRYGAVPVVRATGGLKDTGAPVFSLAAAPSVRGLAMCVHHCCLWAWCCDKSERAARPCCAAPPPAWPAVFDVDTDKERAAWEMEGSTDWLADGVDATNGFAFEVRAPLRGGLGCD